MSINDRSNIYEMNKYWLDTIAPRYFDMKDLSLCRVGMFGYTNEVMGNVFEDITNENTILYNEIFYKKASLPRSIYSYAAQQNVEKIDARPASMKIAIGIREKDILKNSITEGTNNFFVLDADTEIIIDDQFKFMLDYDIKISIKQDYMNNYVYTARYMTEKLDNPISPIRPYNSPYIRITRVKQNLTTYLFLILEVHQVNKIIKNKIIYSQDFLEYFSFDIDYNPIGELSDFMVFYREPDKTDFVQIEKKQMDQAVTDKPFCYYQKKDNDTMNISFSPITRFFRPKFNSELKFVFYTTFGEYGNFEYVGKNIKVIPKSQKYDYRELVPFAQILSDSINGKNAKTFEEIKEDVSYLASTCAQIGTEIDLNKYFAHIEQASRMLFVKKRDDVLTRLYGSYLLMEDASNNIVPTNSVNLRLNEKQFDDIEYSTKRYVIKPGHKMAYRGDDKKIVEYVDSVKQDEHQFINPFLTIVNKNPYTVNYYMTSVNQDYFPDYHYINDESSNVFICGNINVYRNALLDTNADTYSITFKLTPNDLTSRIDFKDEKLVVPYIYLIDDKGQISHLINCKRIAYDEDKKIMTFEAQFKTDDYITPYNNLRITSGVTELIAKDRQQMYLQAYNLKISIGVFYKEKNHRNALHDIFKGMEDYCVANIYKIDQPVDIINNMNDVMYSTLLLDRDKDGLIHTVKEYPVLRYDYAKIKKRSDEFFRTFNSNKEMIRDQLCVLTNIFGVSIKLYNTYGRSSYFYVLENHTDKLDRVNLSIKLRIRLNPSKITDEGAKMEIEHFIRKYIESVNDDTNFYLSNLIRKLEDNFKDTIHYINFKNINNYDVSVQSVEKDFPSNYKKNRNTRDFVPEFLNTDKEYNKYGDVKHKILIEFV